MSAAPSSPSGSFRGYSLVEYLRRNKNGIKTILSFVAGIYTARLGAGTEQAVAAGAAVRMLLDAVDYFLTENPK